jgi:hypothetical protein
MARSVIIRQSVVVALCAALIACSRIGPSPETELADAQAEADEATATDLSGSTLAACGLLTRAEVQAAIGPLSDEPASPPEDPNDTAEGRCLWHGADGRVLGLAASGEGGDERIGAIQPSTTAQIPGDWEQARLQGCCLLHAVKNEALLTLDFSSARIDLEQAAKLMNAALARAHEPLDAFRPGPSGSSGD